ncbi:MAG TPA: hypothetical protein VE783_08750 [Candidatus Limnocylindrales bacterium]|nr:hypothetical protein [Candidatus Limnocylindrales bacterium]
MTLAIHAAYLLLLAVTAGLSGTWTGTITTDEGASSPAYLKIVQDGSNISGEVGPSEKSTHPLEDAVLTGSRLAFSTHYTDPDSKEAVTWTFNMTVEGDEMHGKAEGHRGESVWYMTMKVARQK